MAVRDEGFKVSMAARVRMARSTMSLLTACGCTRNVCKRGRERRRGRERERESGREGERERGRERTYIHTYTHMHQHQHGRFMCLSQGVNQVQRQSGAEAIRCRGNQVQRQSAAGAISCRGNQVQSFSNQHWGRSLLAWAAFAPPFGALQKL